MNKRLAQDTQLSRKILEAVVDEDDVDSNANDSEYEDHISEASEEEDVMTMDDVRSPPRATRRNSIDTAPPESSRIYIRIQEDIDVAVPEDQYNIQNKEDASSSATIETVISNITSTSRHASTGNSTFSEARQGVSRVLHLDNMYIATSTPTPLQGTSSTGTRNNTQNMAPSIETSGATSIQGTRNQASSSNVPRSTTSMQGTKSRTSSSNALRSTTSTRGTRNLTSLTTAPCSTTSTQSTRNQTSAYNAPSGTTLTQRTSNQTSLINASCGITATQGTMNSTGLSNAPRHTTPIPNQGHGNGVYVSKNNTVWDKRPPPQGRTRLANIRRDRGPRVNTPFHVTYPLDAFMLFLRPMLHLIIMYTNLRATRVHEEMNYRTEWLDCNETEIKAFIGIIIMMGALRQSKVNLDTFWTSLHGSMFVRATMSRHRFRQFMRFLRFDDNTLRDATDKFAPIREVWETVSTLFGQYYTPGDNLTIDEQLLPFRGNCGFRQYMPSKPDKYGIKFWHVVDSKNYYPLYSIPYLGKREGEKNAVGLGMQVVLKLAEPYFNTGRNITCDNFFTSLDLANKLLEKKLTLVGTVNRNKTFLPEEFKPDRKRVEGSSIFGFQYNSTIVSYVPKKYRSVALLSTLHHDASINETNGKPDIILDYNATKGGVDTLDQMAHTYTTKRRTCRWPLAVFFNLIDLMGIASYVIWCKQNSNWNRSKSNRRFRFLDEVAMGLVQNQIQSRYESCPHKETLLAMDKVMEAEVSGN